MEYRWPVNNNVRTAEICNVMAMMVDNTMEHLGTKGPSPEVTGRRDRRRAIKEREKAKEGRKGQPEAKKRRTNGGKTGN